MLQLLYQKSYSLSMNNNFMKIRHYENYVQEIQSDIQYKLLKNAFNILVLLIIQYDEMPKIHC